MQKLMKWYRNTKHLTLMARLAEPKHKLKVTSEFLRNKKLLAQRNFINEKFQLNQKKISIKTTPSKADIETFWSSIWTKSFLLTMKTLSG